MTDLVAGRGRGDSPRGREGAWDVFVVLVDERAGVGGRENERKNGSPSQMGLLKRSCMDLVTAVHGIAARPPFGPQRPLATNPSRRPPSADRPG